MKLEKVTDGRRRYHDACGTALALDILGERWAMLVVRELMLGPRRFGDLRAGLPGVSANVLTQRLEGLEAAGVVIRRRLPPPASVQVYELSPWGYEAEDILKVMGRWAARSPDHDPTLPLSPVSLMLSFRTMFQPKKAGYGWMSLGFRFGDETFVVQLAAGVLTAERGAPDGVDALITGPVEAVAAVVYGDPATVEARIDESLTVEGDRNALVRFSRWFELPPKAVATA
ncbi:MAG: transcriptional regulator [Brevundimonas sp.]|uniref:winged helix-turn-helix transcriptional regulator n=1 Tax=Brevundimonas sp. TaxID=1871086 RepID=UPI0025BC37DA|nr:winged helix-turn-helix transcriptional regulator [Brevundimonas sp.]MBX3477130.1 transcriptional regulator [Brevundimonas sp.]